MRLEDLPRQELGPVGDLPAAKRVQAASLVKSGKLYDLAAVRFPGMPLFPGHPPLQVLSFRSPPGIRVAGDQPWGPGNEVGLGYMSEVISGTAHTGAHVDALAHITIGPDDHWYNGFKVGEHLGDFGPTRADAAKLPPFFTRGVLLDVAGYQDVRCLPKGYAIGAAELQAVAKAQGVEIEQWDVVLVRTGYGSLWPDPDEMAAHRGPGPDVESARWLTSLGVVATGSDTETYEVQPAPEHGHPRNPQPVHTHLLIENGVYIMESLDLETLAADRIYEFLFVMLPVKVRGATGSMVDPVAVV
jgi:kynurenine formamidase